MRKFTIYNLQFTIFAFLFTFYIVHFTFYIPSALALESTPSADIKAKLEELKKEIASKAAKLKQEVSGKLKDKAYVGKVKTKSDSSLTLATRNGPKIVNINQDTAFDSNVKGKKYSQKLISEEDYLATLGDVDETGVLTARQVILLPTTGPQGGTQLKTYLWGQIVSISDKLVTLKDKNSKSIAISTDSSDIKVLDFVILTGSFNKNDIFNTEFVYMIPQGGMLKTKKNVYPVPKGTGATPSAKVASPSASPKPASH